jgi:hypothetical protein
MNRLILYLLIEVVCVAVIYFNLSAQEVKRTPDRTQPLT